METVTERVPLKAWQRLRLVYECVPLFFFAAMVSVLFAFFGDVIQGQQRVFWYVFIAVVVAVLGYQSVQRLRDLFSGTVVVETDKLERSRHSSRGPMMWGNFERLGRMRMTRKAFAQAPPGARYKIYYSPASKIVWEMERV